MPDGTYQKGLAGESRAEAYLKNRGMVLLQRRYRSPFGEIDLVMADGDALVFVEVKARSTAGEGAGLEAVTAAKQKKLVKTALLYLAEQNWQGPARFDVVELTRDGAQHVVNAFEAGAYAD
jgi:putative endonuclease